MDKNKIDSNKSSFLKAKNNQEKLQNATNSLNAKEANLNQHHNSKKESLGPNTQR